MENSETETLDFEQYTAREIERLENVLTRLQENFDEHADEKTARAILQTQNKIDKYRGERARRMRTPEDEGKAWLDTVAAAFPF